MQDCVHLAGLWRGLLPSVLRLAQLMNPEQQPAMGWQQFAHVLQDKQGQMQWPQMLQ